VATSSGTAGSVAAVKPWQRAAAPRWSAQAWGAIGAVALFIGITCWWLTQDRSIPIYDAGKHLSFAFYVYEELRAEHITRALTLAYPYPPFVYLVGDLGILFGGINVAPPVVAENLVFVPLLALGCYQVGRMAFDRTAGLLAVIFALGSPMISAQFHVFMTDAPETAMVAVSLWAILATEGFTRVGPSVAAGAAVGLGLLTKEPFVFFVAGPVVVTAIRGGAKAWRGLAAFALVTVAIALPWYAHELAQVQALGSSAVSEASNPEQPGNIAPPRFSSYNLEWYFWNIINAQLYLPLFAFSVVGWLWAITALLRRRSISRFTAELTLGAFVGWFAITETFVRENRYSMPLLVYLAVFGVGWITRLPRTRLAVAVIAVALLGAGNVLATSFGVGGLVSVKLPGTNASALQRPGQLTLFSNAGFWVAAPQRDGDLLATLERLKRVGARAVVIAPSTLANEDFSDNGVFALNQIAGLVTVLGDQVVYGDILGPPIPLQSMTQQYAFLRNGPIRRAQAPPCLTLANGTGVWITLGDPSAPGARDYCPSRRPSFYD
jgi:4-amino-4-deoxy-L-arabinose transferase-like glycosyltransferase